MTIICLDDHPSILDGLVKNINKILPDVTVFAFQNARTALECAQENGCDVLICEIKLAGEDGLIFAEKIQRLNPSVNIIFTTVCEEGERAKEVMRLHPSGYLTKPYSSEQIAAELSNLRHPLNTQRSASSQSSVSVASLYRSPMATVTSQSKSAPIFKPTPEPQPRAPYIPPVTPLHTPSPVPPSAPAPEPISTPQAPQKPVCTVDSKKSEEKVRPMSSRELRKLSRAELLEMLIKQTKENEMLKNQLHKTEEKLESKILNINNAGSIAQAAMQVNGVFEAAQQAADQYLENVRLQSGHLTASYTRCEQDYSARAEQILSDARAQCAVLEHETAKKCEKMTRQAEAEVQSKWAELHEKMEAYLHQHEQLRSLMSMYK